MNQNTQPLQQKKMDFGLAGIEAICKEVPLAMTVAH